MDLSTILLPKHVAEEEQRQGTYFEAQTGAAYAVEKDLMHTALDLVRKTIEGHRDKNCIVEASGHIAWIDHPDNITGGWIRMTVESYFPPI